MHGHAPAAISGILMGQFPAPAEADDCADGQAVLMPGGIDCPDVQGGLYQRSIYASFEYRVSHGKTADKLAG